MTKKKTKAPRPLRSGEVETLTLVHAMRDKVQAETGAQGVNIAFGNTTACSINTDAGCAIGFGFDHHQAFGRALEELKLILARAAGDLHD